MTKEMLDKLRAQGFELDEGYDAVAETLERSRKESEEKEIKKIATETEKKSEQQESGKGNEPADPITGIITANFIFINDLSDSPDREARFDDAKSYFEKNVLHIYNPTYAVNINSRIIHIKSKFTFQTGTVISNVAPANTFYVRIREDGPSRSHVNAARTTIFLNVSDRGNTAAHETGHLLGLSDRYHYVGAVSISPNPFRVLNTGAITYPMNLPKIIDNEYTIRSGNLMSDDGDIITTMQWQVIFSGRWEQQYTQATFYGRNSGTSKNPKIKIPALMDNWVFVGMNLYFLKDVNNNDFSNQRDGDGIFYILNGGTQILNFSTLNQTSQDLWDQSILQKNSKKEIITFYPNQLLICLSQQ